MEELKDLGSFMPEGWEGKFPPCQIQVDAEGKLWHDQAPMIHPKIIQLIYDSVHLDQDDVYYLEIDGKRCQLEVADTFHVVAAARVESDAVALTLNDGTAEDLDPTTLSVGGGDVLYCRVKDGAFPARFSRAAYYQLAEHIGEDGDGFALSVGGKSYPVA